MFLTDQGCGVHGDRPLVCRIYPLVQKLTGDGHESFAHPTPHPETEGVYGHEKTIEDFLMAQRVMPFLQVRDRYLAVVYRLLDILAQDVEANDEVFETTKHTFCDEESIQQALGQWLDMDRVIASYCEMNQLIEPMDLEKRLMLHLEVMGAWINRHSKGDHDESQIEQS